MNTLTETPQTTELAPVPAGQRIEALDAVRGFALIGICLMNVEFFNRAITTVDQGMPIGLTGIDWLASFLVAHFVAGKFWTIFSLLFGMGFAVMLTRAESAGRGFLTPYMRRIAALAVFGALHHVFLFGGDILFNYSVSAVFLLVALYGTWKWMLAAIVVLIGVAFVPGFGIAAGGAAGNLAFSGLIALYLRNERRPLSRSVTSLVLLAAGVIGAISATVMWTMKVGPAEARGPIAAVSGLLLLLSFLANKYHKPADARPWRAGAAIFLFSSTMMTIGGLVDYLTPPPPVAAASGLAAAERTAEREKGLKERAEQVATENKTMRAGSYAEVLVLRANHFAEHESRGFGFAPVVIAMFLIGTWFIRSGVMEKTREHLPLFRKLAFFALPGGIALGLLGSLISTSHVPGVQHDGYLLASGLRTLGNLPASLGYVGLVVLMLHSASVFSRVRVLAPFGRMALTNYLGQSLLMSTFFFGYGLGQWGMPRAMQLVFALALCALQIVFSHWWLARFRYGPAEWLWRAITYMKIPALRIEAPPPGVDAQAAR